MVVVWSVADDHVGFPFTDEPADRAPVLHRHHEFAVVDVQDLGLDAENCGALFHFSRAPQREWTTGDPPVSDGAVRAGNELDMVPQRRPLRSRASGRKLAVVRVGAEDDDAELAVVVRWRGTRQR